MNKIPPIKLDRMPVDIQIVFNIGDSDHDECEHHHHHRDHVHLAVGPVRNKRPH